MAKQKKRWVFSPSGDPKKAIPEATKNEVERKANELIETTLKSKYVGPPPKEPKFNYVIGLSTRVHALNFAQDVESLEKNILPLIRRTFEVPMMPTLKNNQTACSLAIWVTASRQRDQNSTNQNRLPVLTLKRPIDSAGILRLENVLSQPSRRDSSDFLRGLGKL